MAYLHLRRLRAAAMLLALSSPAWAQAQASKADQARAATLKKQGDDLVHQSKFKEALDAYDKSFAIVPNPAIFYNRGRALQSMGDYVGALDALEKFIANAPADLKAKVPNLDKTMAEIATHVSTLVIKTPVAGAAVTINDKSVGNTPLQPQRLVPGDVTISINASGYIPYTQAMSLQAGETTTLEPELKKPAPASEQTAGGKEPTPFDQQNNPPPVKTETPSSGGGSGWKVAAWTSGAAGLVSLGVGLGFMGVAISDKSSGDATCPNKQCDPTGFAHIQDALTASTVSTVLVVAGGVLLGFSLVSFIVAGHGHAAAAPPPTQARLYFGPGSAGISGTF